MSGALLKALLVGMLSIGSAFAQSPEQLPFQRPAMLGQMIDVGGRQLHLRCTGAGDGPVIVFEAALATWSSHYAAMQDALASFARVCTYDRAGLGWSDPAPLGRSIDAMASDLDKLLKAAHIAPPYLLVGHSLGGLILRLHASKHPADVAGVVLIESSSESINFTPAYVSSRLQRIAMIDSGLKVGKPGIPVMPMPPGSSAEAIMAMLPEIMRATKDELESFERTPQTMLVFGGFGRLGEIPLTVIRRGRTAQPPNAGDIAWQEAQERLLELSTSSRIVVAEKSGHMVPIDEPSVVADAVRLQWKSVGVGR